MYVPVDLPPSWWTSFSTNRGRRGSVWGKYIFNITKSKIFLRDALFLSCSVMCRLYVSNAFIALFYWILFRHKSMLKSKLMKCKSTWWQLVMKLLCRFPLVNCAVLNSLSRVVTPRHEKVQNRHSTRSVCNKKLSTYYYKWVLHSAFSLRWDQDWVNQIQRISQIGDSFSCFFGLVALLLMLSLKQWPK